MRKALCLSLLLGVALTQADNTTIDMPVIEDTSSATNASTGVSTDDMITDPNAPLDDQQLSNLNNFIDTHIALNGNMSGSFHPVNASVGLLPTLESFRNLRSAQAGFAFSHPDLPQEVSDRIGNYLWNDTDDYYPEMEQFFTSLYAPDRRQCSDKFLTTDLVMWNAQLLLSQLFPAPQQVLGSEQNNTESTDQNATLPLDNSTSADNGTSGIVVDSENATDANMTAPAESDTSASTENATEAEQSNDTSADTSVVVVDNSTLPVDSNVSASNNETASSNETALDNSTSGLNETESEGVLSSADKQRLLQEWCTDNFDIVRNQARVAMDVLTGRDQECDWLGDIYEGKPALFIHKGWRDQLNAKLAYVIQDLSWGIAALGACTRVMSNSSSLDNSTEDANSTAALTWVDINNEYSPDYDLFMDRLEGFNNQSMEEMNTTIEGVLSTVFVPSMVDLPAQMIADQLQYYLPIVYPSYLWKVIVLPGNLSESDYYFECKENCLNVDDLNGRRVIAAWLPTNSTPSLTEQDFAGLNQAGEDLAAIGQSFTTGDFCTEGVLVVPQDILIGEADNFGPMNLVLNENNIIHVWGNQESCQAAAE